MPFTLPRSIDDLELAFYRENYAEGWGLNGTVLAATNYIRNPSAETNSNGWVSSGPGTIGVTRDTTDSHSGAASIKVVTDGTNANQGCRYIIPATGVSIPSDSIYRAGFWVKGTAGQSVCTRTRNEYSDLSFDLVQSDPIVLTGSWQWISTPNGIPVDFFKTLVQVWVGVFTTVALPTTFFVDDSVCSLGTAEPVYFTGGSTNDSNFSYVWEGTPNASASYKYSLKPSEYFGLGSVGDVEYEYWAAWSGLTPKRQFSLGDHMLAGLRNIYIPFPGDPITVARRNYALNPMGVSGGAFSSWLSNRWSWTNSYITGGPASQPTAIRITAPADQLASTLRGIDVYGSMDPPTPGGPFSPEIKPGDTVSFSVDSRLSIDGGVRLQIRFHDGVNWTGAIVTNSTVPTLANVYSGSGVLTATAPPGSKYFCVTARNANPLNFLAGTTWDFTNFLITVNDTNPAFFAVGRTNLTRWSGVANASYTELMDPSQHGITDLLMARFMAGSGLTSGTMADHELAYYKAQLGL